MSSPLTKEKLIDIGSYILSGMTEREACILTDTNFSSLLDAKETDEVIRHFLELKNTEFKLNHIETIQKTKSEKNSMYLLEKLRPEEFGSRPRTEGPTINIISAIIKDIQNDNSQIITFNRGSRKELEDANPIREVSGLLN